VHLNPAEEQAVIIKVRLTESTFGTSEERARICALEDSLARAIQGAGAGELDGDEYGGGFCTLYLYGPSAARLEAVVLPILLNLALPSGSVLIRRLGPPGAVQEETRLSSFQ
jgi:hypothetical protein